MEYTGKATLRMSRILVAGGANKAIILPIPDVKREDVWFSRKGNFLFSLYGFPLWESDKERPWGEGNRQTYKQTNA